MKIIASCEAHADLPVEDRSKEGPSRLCSSPLAFGETWATKRGVEPSDRRVQPIGPQQEVKPAASRTLPAQEVNREPSPVVVGEGRGRGEELGGATLRNPAAYGARNGGTASVGTGETRLRPSSETPEVPTRVWTGRGEPYKR